MSEHRRDPEHDPAFERLRAADPAAGLSPDRAALGSAVRARLDGPGDELAAARTARAARRPNRWLAVAAVAAGTLAVGSAGYALGAGGGADPVAGDTVSAAITLPGAGAAAGAGSQPGVATQEMAADAALGSAAARSSVASMPWFGGRTVFRAEGLSDAPGTADAWAYDAAAVFGAEAASRVAAAVGLQGDPRLEGGTWTVGAQDGTGPALYLQPDGLASVSYYDPTRDPFACAEPLPLPLEEPAPEDVPADPAVGGGTDGSAGTTDSSGAASEPSVGGPGAPVCPQAAVGDAPTGDAAIARARDLIAATGVDPDRFGYEVQDMGQPGGTYVAAFEVIGGQRTGTVWSVTLVGDGVQAFYGALAPLVPLGTYDVVSENAAVERLSDPRFGSFFGGPVMAADAPVRELAVDPSGPAAGGVVEEPAGDPRPPAAARPGTPFAWPVVEVTLTEARLGLAQHTQPDGAVVLLPAYELSGADGAVWSVVAVAESGLDLTAP